MTGKTISSLYTYRIKTCNEEGVIKGILILSGWQYTNARMPEKAVSASYRQRYPIPKAELDKNLYLKQNPGY